MLVGMFGHTIVRAPHPVDWRAPRPEVSVLQFLFYFLAQYFFCPFFFIHAMGKLKPQQLRTGL
jgi:hypothetical protein